MKIYRTTDRLTVKIEELEVKLAPLKQDQKIEIQGLFTAGEKIKGTITALKYSVKHVKGLEDLNGEEYKLEFEGDALTDACIDDLLNIEISGKLQLACAHLVNGIPTEITHPETGMPIEGIKIINNEVKKKRKR